ncbi:putative phosphatidate phosphatase [Drosophila busckii]|uniref:putative phosphatidate phosphatase n=1 Tax=Drosophila busckii TaxID=30019 RepID=UPI00083F3608|nr:putative phosphatidate phosphatase [Drosophila busckii]
MKSVCDTTPLQRFESQSSSSEEPSSPTTASLLAAAAASAAGPPSNGNTPAHHLNNNNNIDKNVKVDLQLPPFVDGGGGGAAAVGAGAALGLGMGMGIVNKARSRGTAFIFKRIFLHLLLLSCVGLTMLGFSLWGEPYKRGFFCNDHSLMHPYKESTVRSWMLYLNCAALPIVLILLVEFFRAHANAQHLKVSLRESTGYYLCHLELPSWLLACYRYVGSFVFGLGLEQLTTDISKYAAGRLRPHFFALCQPVMPDGTNCSHARNLGRYIENFSCSAAAMSAKRLKDMRLSFPSGHASFACYSMIFLAIYLQRRWQLSSNRLLRHLLQFILILFAWYTALTRVSDYKHHWSDVLAGSAIGFSYAIVVSITM